MRLLQSLFLENRPVKGTSSKFDMCWLFDWNQHENVTLSGTENTVRQMVSRGVYSSCYVMYTHNCRWFQGGPYSQLLEESWLITLSVIFRSCFESRHLPRLYPNTVLKNWLTSTGSLPLPKLSSTPPYGCAWLVHPVWHCAGWHWVLSISAPLKNARSNINWISRYRIKPLSCFFLL